MSTPEDTQWPIDPQTKFTETNLHYRFQLSGDDDQAISVLRECVDKYPDEVVAYLGLSGIYLRVGRLGESFNWALKASQIFPDDPRTALHLWFISHPTGKELLPEVTEAFRAFLPGGRFADQSPFIQVSIDELLEMSQNWRITDLVKVYQAGRIPWLMLCIWRNVSPFRAHYEMAQYGGVRYVAHGEQYQDIASLMKNSPQEIVLDYTAWLTVWSLFGAKSLNILSRYFEQIYIPHALRASLLEEQDRLATSGQLARYQAQCIVRDALNKWEKKIVWHDGVRLEEGRDISGDHTEKAVAQQDDLVYLNEHLSPSDSVPKTAIGIAVLADLLAHAGDIDTLTQQNLKRNRHPVNNEELILVARFEEKRELVISIVTLATWAMYADDLNSLFGFFERIHLAEPSRKRLLNEIAAFETGQHILDTFREMRQLLYQWEASDLIVFETIPEKEYVNRSLFQERQVIGTDEQAELDSTRKILFDYYDELVGIALRRDLPIWTDDRFTKILNIDGRRPAFTFSTDSFLAFAHNHPGTSERIGREQYHTYYDKL